MILYMICTFSEYHHPVMELTGIREISLKIKGVMKKKLVSTFRYIYIFDEINRCGMQWII